LIQDYIRGEGPFEKENRFAAYIYRIDDQPAIRLLRGQFGFSIGSSIRYFLRCRPQPIRFSGNQRGEN